jgi:hypothetical protein
MDAGAMVKLGKTLIGYVQIDSINYAFAYIFFSEKMEICSRTI